MKFKRGDLVFVSKICDSYHYVKPAWAIVLGRDDRLIKYWRVHFSDGRQESVWENEIIEVAE